MWVVAVEVLSVRFQRFLEFLDHTRNVWHKAQLELPLLEESNFHPQEVQILSALHGETREVLFDLVDHAVHNGWFNVRKDVVIDVPSYGSLLAVYDFVGNAPVVRVDFEAFFVEDLCV